MKVIVASKNPAKLAAIQKAFTAYFPKQKLDFICQKTASGVSEQPLTIEETIQGAINRVRSCQNQKADFAVGIEGGISFYTLDDHEYAVEISWVCVLNCHTGVNEIACAPGFPVFPHVLKHIHAGKSLSAAMEDEYGLKNLGKQNGYIGWLSNNVVTRESSNFEAVYLALSSLMKEQR